MTVRFYTLTLTFVGLCLMVAPAWCAELTEQANPASLQRSDSSSQMLDISAEESLEWYEDTRLYVARGKAKAVRADMTVEADLLTAHARDPQTKDTNSKTKKTGDIDKMTAEGNVHIRDTKQQVFGQKAVYDLDQKVIKVTGSNLKYQTATDVVTAKDSLEYHEEKNIALARGRAIAEHEGNRIESDVLSAAFVRTTAGQMEMKEIRAKGNVIIVTKDGGVSRGDNALYDAKEDKAYLMDNVRLTKGETQLSGDRAEVDFKSGQSRLLNSGSGRVRALLPASGTKKEKASP